MKPLIRLVVSAFLCVSLVPPVAAAVTSSEQERTFLSLYFNEEELKVISATRSLKPVASTAENVAVVTAEEIELMNAHTVAEALYNLVGIEMADFKGPGSEGQASIHGSGVDRVTVMLDGVPLTSANNSFQLATLPVQLIKRIEVIKGPASSTWGSSFGGVINVITKSVEGSDRVDGMLSASVGKQDTNDLRAELYANKDRVGIYLYGGRMTSDGLRDSHGFTHQNLFGKVSLDAGRRTRLDLVGFYHHSDSVNADDLLSGRDAYNGFILESLYGKADLQTSLTENVDLRLSAWRIRSNDNFYENQLSTDVRTRDAPLLFDRYGFSGNLAWRTEHQTLVAGADSSHARFENEFEPFDGISQDKYALFVNDTISADDLHVTPGLRYDHSSLAGGLVSPSLGATYLSSRDLLFRALVSRGFHDPAMVRYFDWPVFGYQAKQGLVPEKVWSYQAGVEANLVDLLRAKFTLFYHDIDDILVETALAPGVFTLVNAGSARTAGGEFEIATNALRGFVLKSGLHHERITLVDFSDRSYAGVRDVTGVNAALTYDAKRGFRGTIKAHYLWLDMTEPWGADSRGVVVDVFVTQSILSAAKVGLDLFAGAHNLFDVHSYSDRAQKNPGRWLEAGARCTF